MGVLVSVKLKIFVVYVEVGLRSFDWMMFEEINRILVDYVSEVLFFLIEEVRKNFEWEGIMENVYVVGNIIVDVVF